MLYIYIIIIYIDKICSSNHQIKIYVTLTALTQVQSTPLIRAVSLNIAATAPWCWEQGVTGNSREQREHNISHLES